MRARILVIGTGLAVALALVAGCGSDSKSSSTTAETTATTTGGVTVPTDATGTTVNVVVSDTKGLDGPMTLTSDKSTVPAGSVTFVVKDTGTIDHEVVVLKTDTAFDKLPIVGRDGEPDRISEDGNVGETGDPHPKAGETRAFTIDDMAAGNYALVCNLNKHYGLGMRAAFTVS